MTTPAWRVNGQDYETCSCDFVCPCVPGQMAVRPSKGSCTYLVEMAASGAMGINAAATEPLHLDNTGHPAANRFALAHASKSHVHALGLSWDDVTGTNNGQYAPFSWQSA